MDSKCGQLTACKRAERELENTFSALCPSCWSGCRGDRVGGEVEADKFEWSDQEEVLYALRQLRGEENGAEETAKALRPSRPCGKKRMSPNTQS